jgi:type I restriction enzyme S subunit
MTKLDRLIADLCPGGVEYKTFQEAFDIKNGYIQSKGNPLYWKDGTLPWFRCAARQKRLLWR